MKKTFLRLLCAMLTGSMQIGDQLSIDGRVQSRQYTKIINATAFERTAYEVSIMHLTDGGACAQQ